jgi:hypothetical protein
MAGGPVDERRRHGAFFFTGALQASSSECKVSLLQS